MATNHPTTVSEAYPELPKWKASVLVKAPTSMELWAAGKFIGRECATVNKEFTICKMEKGDHPGLCINHADLVNKCTMDV
jgi:hypothetical protein